MYLVSGLTDSNGAADVSCTTAVDDSVVDDEIPNSTDGVVKRTLRLVDDL